MPMRLKHKFLLLAALTVGLVLVLATLAVMQLHTLQIKEEQRQAQLNELERASQYILTANIEFKKQIQHWKNILLRGNHPADFAKQKELFLSQERRVQHALHEAAQVRQEFTAQIEINALIKEHARVSEQYQQGLQQFDADDFQSGQKLDAKIRGVDSALTEALQSKVDSLALRHAELHKAKDTLASAELKQAQTWIALTSLLCIAALITLMYFILRSVLRQIGGDPQDAVIVAKNVARGNLALQIAKATPHSVLSHLQDMVYGLSDIIIEVHQTCKDLHKIAQQVDTAADQLAKNAAEAARMVAISSSALEQIAITVAQNAEHSKKLALLVDTTPETADLITEINCASKEQATGIAENSNNLLQLAHRTRENALQAENLSRSASNLQQQTQILSDIVNQFKTA